MRDPGPAAGREAGHPPRRPPGWYAADLPDEPPRPPFAGPATCDLAIVGGGLTGLSAALEGAERGLSVRLLEAERVGFGATGRNGGHLTRGFNKGVAALRARFGDAGAQTLVALADEAMALVRDRVARHAILCDLRWGALITATRRTQIAELRAELEGWRWAGAEGLRLMGADEARAAVAARDVVGGLWDDRSGQIQPLAYAHGLAQAAEAAGAVLHEGSRARGWQPAPGGGWDVVTEGGVLRAGALLLAGNAYLRPCRTGATLPVGTYMMATEPLGRDLLRQLIPSDAAVMDANFVVTYYRRSSDDRLLFGGGVSYSRHRPSDVERELRPCLARVFPQLGDVRIDHAWAGEVALTLSRLPQLARPQPGLWVAHGYSGHGLALSGLYGAVVARAVAGEGAAADALADITHRRFPGGDRLAAPLLFLGTLWYRLRDRF